MAVARGDPPGSQLDYAQPATPEGLVVERRADGAVVTVLPRRSRILSAVGWFAGTLAFAAAFAGAIVYFNPPRAGGVPWGMLVWPAIVVLFSTGQLVTALVSALYPARWVVDSDRLVYTGRTITGVVREQWPRRTIADLRVERLRLKDQWWPRPHLVMVSPAGEQAAIDRGDRRSINALCTVLREALRLPPDPAGEKTYPALPAGGRLRRTSRTVTQGGVWLVHRPPRITWPVVAVALPLLLAGALAADWYFIRPEIRFAWTVTESRAWSVFRVALLTLFPLSFLCWGVYRLRRWTTIGVQWDEMDLVETGLVRPCHEEWPLAEVAGVDVACSPGGGRGRAKLLILLRDGKAITALDGEPRKEVDWVAANLRHAMARAERIT